MRSGVKLFLGIAAFYASFTFVLGFVAGLHLEGGLLNGLGFGLAYAGISMALLGPILIFLAVCAWVGYRIELAEAAEAAEGQR